MQRDQVTLALRVHGQQITNCDRWKTQGMVSMMARVQCVCFDKLTTPVGLVMRLRAYVYQ